MKGWILRLSCVLALMLLPLILTACGPQPAGTQSSGVADRQEQALHDPMHYSPNVGNPDISGGGIGEMDRDGMRKDLDHVLNP